MGRFVSPDKIGGKVGFPQTWNRYSYAGNNPLKLVDPDGKEPHLAAAFIGGVVGAGFQVYRNYATGQSLSTGVGTAFFKGAVTGLAVSLAGPFVGTLGRPFLSGGVAALAQVAEKKLEGAGPNETKQAAGTAATAGAVANLTGQAVEAASVLLTGTPVGEAGKMAINVVAAVAGKEFGLTMEVIDSATGATDAAKQKDQQTPPPPPPCVGRPDSGGSGQPCR